MVKRQDLFVTSKLWNHHHKQEDVEPTLRESLRKLRLDYVDAYLVHWPVTTSPGPGLDPPYQVKDDIGQMWAAPASLLNVWQEFGGASG